MTHRLTRRELLGTAAAIGATSVAGCSGEGSSGSGPEWPMFQADRRNTGVVDTQGPTSEPERRWRIPLEEDELQPIRVEDTLFVGGEVEDEAALFALDVETGEERWRAPELADVEGAPAYADGRLYVSADNALHAVNPDDGSIEWTWDERGTDPSPTPVDGTVYIGGGEVYAVDAESGELQASSDVSTFGGPRGSLAVGDDVIVAGIDEGLYALDRSSLEVLWDHPVEDRIGGAATIHDGHAFVGSWDGHCYAVDVESGELEWSFETDDWVETTPVPYGDAVIFGNGNGWVYSVDVASGDKNWEYRMGTTAETLAIAGDTLYGAGGDIVALDPTDGTEHWSIDPGNVFRALSVIDGTVYASDDSFAGSGGHLYAFEEAEE